tara:strand:- start:88899 stop:89105 length:207 start_codon:yes stop_codon:yes gene_type:complete
MGNPKDITGQLVRSKGERLKANKLEDFSNAGGTQGRKSAHDLFRVFTYSLIIICFIAQLFLIVWMDLF